MKTTIIWMLAAYLVCLPCASANQQVPGRNVSMEQVTLSAQDIIAGSLVPDHQKGQRLHPLQGHASKSSGGTLTAKKIISGIKENLVNRQTVAVTEGQRRNLSSLVGEEGNKVNARVLLNQKNGTPRLIKIEGRCHVRSAKNSVAQELSIDAAEQFLNANRSLLKIENPKDEFTVKNKWTDNLGVHHVRYQQQYREMPLWGKEALVHMDESNRIYMFQGSFEPTPCNAEKVFRINEQKAIAAVYSHMGIVQKTSEEVKSIEPVWYTLPVGKVVSAYAVEVQPDLIQNWIYFIDGNSGDVLHRVSLASDQVINTSGIDLGGIAQNFLAWQDPQSGDQLSIDPTRPLDDQPYKPLPIKDFGNTYLLDARNTMGDEVEAYWFTGPDWDPAAVSMAHHIGIIDAYWKDTFNRNGIDDNNINYLMVGNVGENHGNASWTGTNFIFGSGDESISNLAGSFDITAHEYTHGVIRATANLLYENQSGALNEGYADIFACMVDRDDWTVGEEVTLVQPFFIRNLMDPSQGLIPLPTKMSEYRNLPVDQDHGGVHINCGIPSRAAYLLAEGLSDENLGASIGRDKTEQIFYRALTVYLTQSSIFSDARVATIQAARDLYGNDEAGSVQAAWDAVEVFGQGQEEPTDPDGPTPTDPITGEDIMIYLSPINDSTEQYDVYVQQIPKSFEAGDAPLISGPLNVAAPASYMRPSAITLKGETGIFYVGTDHNLYMIMPDGSEMAITDSGEVHSMAISPDGKYFAFKREDSTDNRIFVGDLTNDTLTEYELISSSTAPGDVDIQNTVMFADSLSFDYTSSTLVFDAYNKMVIGSEKDEYTYWTIGCLDLNTGLLSWPFPNQNPNYDIGNASFAYNNSFVVAIDVFDHSTYPATHWVWTFNLETQTITAVATSNPTDYSGFEGLVCGVPSFWGDDDAITMQIFHEDFDDLHSRAIKVPLDENWAPASNQTILLNSEAAVKPIMHRVGNRELIADINVDRDACTFAGDTAFQEVVITNSGNRDIRIYNIAITGPGKASFRHDGVNGLIPRGQSKSIKVYFEPAPDAVGTQAATLVVHSDADIPVHEVSLTGNVDTGTGTTGEEDSSGGGSGCFISVTAP